MAKKETTRKAKASKQAKPKAVDMVSPVTPADETGLELTEQRIEEATVTPEVPEETNITTIEEPVIGDIDIEETPDITPDEEVCTADVPNQELEPSEEPVFKEDKAMVNDITNILNGIDGVKASKLEEDEEVDEEVVEETGTVKGKNMTNTEKKNYFSEQFSRNWGGVMYDY